MSVSVFVMCARTLARQGAIEVLQQAAEDLKVKRETVRMIASRAKVESGGEIDCLIAGNSTLKFRYFQSVHTLLTALAMGRRVLPMARTPS